MPWAVCLTEKEIFPSSHEQLGDLAPLLDGTIEMVGQKNSHF